MRLKCLRFHAIESLTLMAAYAVAVGTFWSDLRDLFYTVQGRTCRGHFISPSLSAGMWDRVGLNQCTNDMWQNYKEKIMIKCRSKMFYNVV